jgi:hypothetical protein
MGALAMGLMGLMGIGTAAPPASIDGPAESPEPMSSPDRA